LHHAEPTLSGRPGEPWAETDQCKGPVRREGVPWRGFVGSASDRKCAEGAGRESNLARRCLIRPGHGRAMPRLATAGTTAKRVQVTWVVVRPRAGTVSAIRSSGVLSRPAQSRLLIVNEHQRGICAGTNRRAAGFPISNASRDVEETLPVTGDTVARTTGSFCKRRVSASWAAAARPPRPTYRMR